MDEELRMRYKTLKGWALALAEQCENRINGVETVPQSDEPVKAKIPRLVSEIGEIHAKIAAVEK